MRRNSITSTLLTLGLVTSLAACSAPVATTEVPRVPTSPAAASTAPTNLPADAAANDAPWFDALDNEDRLSPEEAEQVAVMTAALLRRQHVNTTAIWEDDREARIVFLALSDGISAANVVWGSGQGVRAAAEAAVEKAHAQSVSTAAFTWLRVDVVAEVGPRENFDPENIAPLREDPTLFGLALDAGSRVALLPDQLTKRGLSNVNAIFDWATFTNVNAIIDWGSLTAEAKRNGATLTGEITEAYPFSTHGFFFDAGSRDPQPVYRGHRVIEPPVDADTILQAAIRAGEYLTRSVNEEGRFVYVYRPDTDAEPDEYNILRHAGTTYAMLELYGVTRDPALLDAAMRAADYLAATTVPCEHEGVTYRCIEEAGEIKLGGNGLALVAFAEYQMVTNDDRYLELMQEFAEWIVATQSADGEFTIHRMGYPDRVVADFISPFCPGEAVLGLMRLYAIDDDSRWLDAAEAAARWLIEVRDGDLSPSELRADHWLMYGLGELYAYRPQPLFEKRALALAQAAVADQVFVRRAPDWNGGYTWPPTSTPSATRNEGLSAVYWIVEANGAPADAKEITAALDRGMAFQLRNQYDPISAMFFDDPQRVLGGFQRSFSEFEIRNDYVQHNLSALLGAYRIMSNQLSSAPPMAVRR